MRLWPFRTEQKSLASPVDWLLALFGATPTASGVEVTPDLALTVPAVANAVRTISEAAASLDVNVVEIAEDRTETVLPSHPVAALLKDEANDWTSGFELIRSIVSDALTRDAGGVGWVNWVNGSPVEIVRFPVGRIEVEFDPNTGEPNYRIGGSLVTSQQVLHLRNAFDRSPVTLAREAIAVALIMEKHAGRLFSRGARPGGVIETPKNVGDDGVKRMLAGWRAAMEGVDNAGKTAVLWDGASFKAMQLSSVDAQFQELRLFQIQEIARAFNIPASMLGDLSRATWSNSEEMRRQFLMLCLEPWLKALEGALRRALFVPDDRKRYAIRFDRDDITSVDLTARATAINSLVASRVLNPNEGRSWLGGLAPYDGGNEFANPNTGASQPQVPAPSKPGPQEDPADAA
jgi:HK97 family phage portal protein